MRLQQIATIHNNLKTKFGIPRQSGVVPQLESSIVFLPEYRDPSALRGLEDFSHIWLIWGFSQVKQTGFSPTVRPPRLGGNTRMGVFATRSPYRPNPLGLSAVRLAGIAAHPQNGPVLRVLGADLMDGTPLYDIKPYLPYVDCLPGASGGFAAQPPAPALQVQIAPQWLQLLPPEEQTVLAQLLAQDPRPAYQQDAGRIYGMQYGNFEVKFSVQNDVLTVHSIAPAQSSNL